LSFLFRNYTIREIEVSKANLRLAFDRQGNPNYEVWKTTETDEETEFVFDLKKVFLNEVHFTYHDLANNHKFDLNINRATMSGNFKTDSYFLTARANLHANILFVDSVVFLKERDAELDLVLQVNDNNTFIFQKGILKINQNAFDVKGTIANLDEGLFFDLNIAGNQLHLGQLLADIPDNLSKYAEGYRGKGTLVFDSQIKGLLNKNENPEVLAEFKVSGGELSHKVSGLNLRKMQFEGSFDNGPKRNLGTSTLVLKDFYTTVNKGVLKGDFKMFDFNKPRLDFKLYADADAGDLVKLFRIDTISSASGKIHLDLLFKGGMSEKNRFTGQDFVSARASGTLNYKNLAFKIKDNPLIFREFNGDLLFRNNDLVVENFSGHAGNSDFELKGFFRNVLPHLFLENEKLTIDASLYSNNLNFNELLKHTVSGTDTTYRLTFSEKLGFNLRAEVVHLTFRKFEATNVKGVASLQNQRFFAQDVTFKSMDGQIKASGFIDGTRSDYFTVACDAIIDQVDINKLFYQMGNFSQTAITDEHIFGIMKSDVQFKGRWTPTLDVDWASIETTANVIVQKGELLNFEPMIALSRFLRVDDLDRVTFSTLENQIRIKDKIVFIPDMEIQSSALNLKLSGEHTFENIIDYRLQILLSEILSRKNRQNRNPQEQYGDIIDDGLGRTTVFLRVTGNIDEPVFRYDAQGVREKMRDNLRREGQTLRNVFRREFGGNPEPETIAPEPEKQQRNLQRRRRQENNRIEIEWDEG
jgi:hypothetical protein